MGVLRSIVKKKRPGMPVTSNSLAKVACNALGFRPRAINYDTSITTPLVTTIVMIFYFPLTWRKLLLDATRIQVPIENNGYLSSLYHDLSPSFISIPSQGDDKPINLRKEIAFYLVGSILDTPLLCALLSYFARAESTYWRDEFLEQKAISFNKEFKAALETPFTEQRIDYTGLFGESRASMHIDRPGEIPGRLSQLYKQGLASIRNEFSSFKSKLLLPAYNGKKNVGRDTVVRYIQSVKGPDALPEDIDYQQTTTLTLLAHYYRTGEKILGPIEMRQAWFFNDLKPRTYYCLGGEAFWEGIYIQPVANRIAQLLPSTNPHTRFDITRLPAAVSGRDVLITYDYSSFTTCLEELQHYMFYLATELNGVPLSVLDPREGVIELNLGELLHVYNRRVNQHQAFSVERFFDCVENFRQGRSGSLGVKGNIVFSMSLHGACLANITGMPDADSCVGDDALSVILLTFVDIFITCVNYLGEINHSKFNIIRPISLSIPDPSYDAFKYLKRPLSLDAIGKAQLGTLDFFPSVADILFEGDGIHNSKNHGHVIEQIKTFCMQWGRFLRIQYNGFKDQLVSEDDLTVLLGMIKAVYDRFGLPYEGAAPGDVRIDVGEERVARLDFMIPPVDYEVFERPWYEILLDRFRGQVVTVPVHMEGVLPCPYDVEDGDRFRATGCALISLMEDLGIVTTEMLVEDVEFDDAYISRYMKWTQGIAEQANFLYNVTVVTRPHWWCDVMDYYAPLEPSLDSWEVASRITSLSGTKIY